MAINKKLIHFKTKAAFEAQLKGNNILDTSIVFIKDANLIWTHGAYYGKSEIHIGTNEPTNGEIIWINSDNDEMKYWNGTEWVTASGGVEDVETLVITLASNQGSPDNKLLGAIIDVVYNGESHKSGWTGESLIFTIPTGVEYTINCSNIVDSNGNLLYSTPTSEMYTAASGNTRVLTKYYSACALTIQRTNNQGVTMSAATSATVTYSSYSQTVNFTSSTNSITITIPYNVSYTIKFNGTITNYRTPANITGTSNASSVTKSGSYDSEKVTVNVSGLSSGFAITVNGQSQTATSGTYYIAYGTAYTISASSVKGYTATVSESSITANSKTRTVTVTYAKLANGIYICDTSGKLTAVGSWNTSNNSSAIGVAVVSDNCSFVIEKTVSYSNKAWGGYGTTISGIATTSNAATAKTDYAGETNTTKIINQLGSGNAPAANYCRGRSCTVNGTTLRGYLGALGEWQTAYNNKSSIDSALSKIGGTAMSTDQYHWTSTQYSSDRAWVLHWDTSLVYDSYKSGSLYARAFYPIP